MLDNRKREVQLEAGKAWRDKGYRGTIALNTGGGKTFIAFDAMVDLPKGNKVLFLAETNQREMDVRKDALEYQKFFGINPLSHVDFEFACYQSAYRWEGRHFHLVCSDEIHDSLSGEYSKFYIQNTYDRLLGLSATVRSKRVYVIDGMEVSKMALMKKIAPVVYSYGIADAQKDGIGRKLNIYIIRHYLDGVTKNLEGGNQKNRFMTTERKIYDYYERLFYQGIYSKKEGLVKLAMAKRAKMLYSLPSKIDACKKLLKAISGKTVVFNNDLDALEKVTPNVVSSPRHGRSKKEQDEINTILRQKFDDGHIRTIGSFKILQQGANLKKLDNVIMMSYYSNAGSYTQKLGRLRVNGDKVGNVFMFVTQGSQEVTWYEKIIDEFPMEEFNVIECNGIDECLKLLT